MPTKAMIYLGDDPQAALQTVQKTSVTILANYGASILVQGEADVLKQLEAGGLRVREMVSNPSVEVGGYEVNTASPQIRATSAASGADPLAATTSPTGLSRQLIRIVGPMHPDWKNQLELLGVRLHQSMSDDTYLASIPGSAVDDVHGLNFVESVVPYEAALKVNPALLTEAVHEQMDVSSALTLAVTPAPAAATTRKPRRTAATTKPEVPPPGVSQVVNDPEVVGNLELVLFEEADLVATADAVRALGAKVIRAIGKRMIVFAPSTLIPSLAALPQVREVNPYAPSRLSNNVATGIMRANVLQSTFGLDGSGQIVGIADTGLDTGVNDATLLDDFEGRVLNIFALGRPGNASDTAGHGTHVAGSVLGNGANSNQKIRGTAPAAQLVFQSIMDAAGGLGGIPADVGVGLFDVSRDQGARIHTNSWGAPVNGAYNARCTDTDTFAFRNREFLICFSAGNEGTTAANKVGSPGTAKNVLTVGASESVRTLPASVNFPASPHFPTGATLPNVAVSADNQNDVADFSSIGPAQNTRRKPDLVAPGTWILSTRSSVSVADKGPDGLTNTGDETGVPTHAQAVGLGLPGQPIMFAGSANAPAAPAGSGAAAANNYMFDSGTSMATPLTAGACALVRQYLVQQRGHTPSGALIKAFMINGAVDMGAGVPNNSQGWGRVELENTISPAATRRTQFDDSLDNAVATGDIRTYDVFVSSAAAPLTVTLVWRDPAGNTIQNRLHLRVTNVATAVTQTSDPIGNIRNNVQKVIVNAPTAGQWRIEVEGVNVGTGISELLPALRQDYALVVSNATGFSCNPSDIVQVLDKSGSMGFSGYMEPAKERAKQFIDLMQINDKVGVVTFESSASEVFPLTLLDSQAVKNSAHAVITPVTSLGSTDLREGLERGVTSLGTDSGRPRALIFLSDGKHTTGPPLIDDAFLDSIAAANIKVHTIAIGPDSDFPTLNNIATRTGTGAVNVVESAADLHKLHEIYYNIIGGAGCGGVIHLNSTTVGDSGLTDTVPVDGTTREAHFAVSWQEPGAELDFSLTDPGGTTFDSATTKAFHFQGSTHAFYRVTLPRNGNWRVSLKVKRNPTQAPLKVTLAVIAESDFHCVARVDRKFLFRNSLLIEHAVSLAGQPVVTGSAFADVTFPTRSIDDLLKKFEAALKDIKVDKGQLGKDNGNLDLIKLGVLIAQNGVAGKDLFARQTVRVPLLSPGQSGDKKAKAFVGSLDFKKLKIAGPFQVRSVFEIKHPKHGLHRCVELLSMFVPAANQ